MTERHDPTLRRPRVLFARTVTPVAALALVTLACSSSGDDADATDGLDGGNTGGAASGGSGGRSPITPPELAPGEEPPLVGTFNVEMIAPTSSVPDGYTSLVGKVYDGPTPNQTIWEESATGGDCVLLEPRNPFCETPCGGSAVCVEDDTCVPYPTARDAGTVTMTGLTTRDGATEFSMDPVANGYQPTGGVQLGLDAFSEGDVIGLSATGGDFSPFTIESRGIARLELGGAEVHMVADAPIDLSWTAAQDATSSIVHVKIDISHHGGTKGKIECLTGDDGALEVTAGLVTALLNLGVSGFPTIVVTRRAVGSTQVEAGRVDLVVSSDVEREIVIEGLTSCTADNDCPTGQSCQLDLRCE